MISTWVGAFGLMSRKASASAVSVTTVAVISPAAIRQNRQSVIRASYDRAVGPVEWTRAGQGENAGRTGGERGLMEKRMGRAVLITGASRGVGRAAAQA